MPSNLEEIVPSFHLKREISELYLASSIRGFAQGMLNLFIPVFLYKLGFTVQEIVLFYVAAFFVRFVTVPWGGNLAKKYGFEHSIMYSVPITILFYLALYLVKFHHFLIFIVPILFALSMNAYWIAYHADFAYYGKDGQRGREIGSLLGFRFALSVIAPFLGGLILKLSGFNVLFLVVSILLFVSVIPLFTTKEKFKPKPVSYFQTFKKFFSRKKRRRFFGYLGFGENIVTVAIWPIFIYLIVSSYFYLGTIISISTLFMALITIYLGKLTDKVDRKKIIKIGTLLLSFSWILKIFAKTPLYVLGVDTFSRASSNLQSIPVYARIYKRASREGTVNDIMFYELGLALGYMLLGLIIYVLLFFTSNIALSFIPAALIALLYMLL